MTTKPAIDKTGSSAGRLKGDSCDQDWMWDRDVETGSVADQLAAASTAWDAQLQHLAEGSRFYARKFKEAGVGASTKLRLADITSLPFTTKDELKQSVDEWPPFGTNAGVAEERIKRVYQTSGTTGTPTVIPLTRTDMDTWTTIGSRTYYATGIHEHHSVLTTFGAGPFVAGHTHFVLVRIRARAVPVAPGDTGRVLIALKTGLADTLLSTPSFAQYLAKQAGGYEPGSEVPAPHARRHGWRARRRNSSHPRPHRGGPRSDSHRGDGHRRRGAIAVRRVPSTDRHALLRHGARVA
ncbi:MAG TPA: hypothetical protein VIO80_09585 [Candidatus Dormibacteraeota bacterium]